MLKNELNHSKEANSTLQTTKSDVETSLKTLERKLKEKEWEINDSTAINDAKLKESDSKLQQLLAANKTMSEEFNRKYFIFFGFKHSFNISI